MSTDSPLVIGGMGGSGTRVVARIVARAGRFMGARLNESHDALDLADFDRRRGPDYLREGTSSELHKELDAAVAAHLAPMADPAQAWGWKHPHSYLLIGLLADHFEKLRFVHLVRDGVEMAFSSNQRQLRRYGELALGPGDDEDPIRRIQFWAWANSRAADEGESLLGDRYLWMRFEDLCRSPAESVDHILRFAQATSGRPAPLDEVSMPPSLGRARKEYADWVPKLEADAGPALKRFGYGS